MASHGVFEKVFELIIISRILKLMGIKSASGINSTPNMYEGDRGADSAFDTVHSMSVYTVIAVLKNDAHLRNNKFWLIPGLGDERIL